MSSRRRIIDDRLYAHFVTFSVSRRRRLLDHNHPKRIVLDGATATILQSTIAENEASGNGGGIAIDSGNVLMHNTLVADNSATTAYPDIDGALLADSSYNLISDGTGMSGITDGTQGNQVGTSVSPIDALLGELGYNGGPTQTIPLRVDSPALDAGSTDLALTRLGRSSSTVYDSLGRIVQQTSVDPDGIGSGEASVTSYTYDAAGNLLTETDPLGNVTEYEYDNLGRVTSVTDPEEGVTSYTYDDLGRMASLTDPEENTTYWSYSPLGQVATETINVDSTDLVRYYSYDARGNLTRKIDRNGRVIDYAYDSLSRLTTETWYDDVTDADAQQDAVTTYSTTYDRVGRVATIGDGEYDFEYTWSIFGNLTSTTQDLTGLSDDVVFNYTYDVLGRQTSVAATIGSTDDYVNTYSYDNLGRITQITQDGVSGGNAVAEKRVDYTYNDDSTRATISRYADLAGTTAVAETEKVFDELGRVTDIVHERAATEFADYDLAWDAAGELTDFDFESLVGDDGETSYTYDDTGQLTAADYASDWQEDESYVYDDNGNRTLVDGTTSYTTGDHNRLTSDDTYNYTYDGEGNVHTKTTIATGESVEYTWDHRNRLTKVTYKNSGGTATKIVEYAYDYGQRWVRKTLDTDADGTIEESQVFVHSGGQIVLDFEKTGTADASNSDLAHRYLWGTNTDDLLADESVDDGTADDVAWALTDHLGSVRDLVVYDPTTETVSVVKHVVYDAYGNVTSDTATGVESLFLYTARPFDPDTALQNNLNRWYDATTGRWLSTDPIGFEAGDVSLYRYIGNQTTLFRDPFGLASTIPKQPAPRPVPDPPPPYNPIADKPAPSQGELDCDQLEDAALDYLTNWKIDKNAQITDTYSNSSEAVRDFYDFWGGLGGLASVVSDVTNLTWAAGAYGSSATGGTTGVVSVIISIIANVAEDIRATNSQQFRDEVLQQMRDIRVQDRKDVKAAVDEAKQGLRDAIAKDAGCNCCDALRAYYEDLKERFPEPPDPPAYNNILGQMILDAAEARGWHLYRYHGVWMPDTEYNLGIPLPWLDVGDVADKLTQLKFYGGSDAYIWPPDRDRLERER